jgi:transposase
MHLRVSRVSKQGKVYEYPQLVESYRRDSDGMPAVRVLAHLGGLSAVEVENLRLAISAGRQGKRVVLARAGVVDAAKLPIHSNLRYLDVALLLHLWREWGLDELLSEIVPRGDAAVPPASVVAALVIQRCVDPGSKLYATEWFPRSALPELLGVPTPHFNNTRLHRVLDELHAATPALMARLVSRYRERDGAFSALFLDVTDTWFVGRGPSFAERGKTKEGRVERKVGIVLLCNAQGYPLRWEVVNGCSHDSVTMMGLLQRVSHAKWLGDAPVVCDRAMGKTAHIVEMATMNVRFVTALISTEFGTYASDLPHKPFAALNPTSEAPSARRDACASAIQCAVEAGLEKVEDNLFVRDLGVLEHAVESEAPVPRAPIASVSEAMRVCRQIHDSVEAGEHPSLAAAGRALGLGKGVTTKYARLRKLPSDIQDDILSGRADLCTLADLLSLIPLREPSKQRVAFESTLAGRELSRRRECVPTPAAGEGSVAPAAIKLLKARVVAYFNPQLFVEKRLRARQKLNDIETAIASLNAKLSRSRRMKPNKIAAAVDRILRGYAVLDVFDVDIKEVDADERKHHSVTLRLDSAKWAKRRRYDGFTVLVAHPSVSLPAAELCRLYRSRDVVEKDFQLIKSVVELRPLHHRDDDKVRAHVTLCMLSLLLQRTLALRLEGTAYSADRALALLESCRLNRIGGLDDDDAVYALTRTDAEQRAILRRLRVSELADDAAVRDRLHPRKPVVVSTPSR